jgi:hypothetical protein
MAQQWNNQNIFCFLFVTTFGIITRRLCNATVSGLYLNGKTHTLNSLRLFLFYFLFFVSCCLLLGFRIELFSIGTKPQGCCIPKGIYNAHQLKRWWWATDAIGPSFAVFFFFFCLSLRLTRFKRFKINRVKWHAINIISDSPFQNLGLNQHSFYY